MRTYRAVFDDGTAVTYESASDETATAAPRRHKLASGAKQPVANLKVIQLMDSVPGVTAWLTVWSRPLAVPRPLSKRERLRQAARNLAAACRDQKAREIRLYGKVRKPYIP